MITIEFKQNDDEEDSDDEQISIDSPLSKRAQRGGSRRGRGRGRGGRYHNTTVRHGPVTGQKESFVEQVEDYNNNIEINHDDQRAWDNSGKDAARGERGIRARGQRGGRGARGYGNSKNARTGN